MPLPVFVSETLHHEAIDWATRVAANGGTISSSVIRAVSAFCAAADSTGPGGFRSALYRFNPFAGGNLSGALVPLYRGPTYGGTTFGNVTDTNVNFVSGDFVETGSGGGLKGNGTNKYLQTGFASNSLPSATSVHLSASATQAATSGNPVFVGSYNNTTPGLLVLDDFCSFNATGRSYRHGSLSAGGFPVVSSPGATEAHVIGTRTAAASAAIYRAGSLSTTNTTNVSTTNNALGMFVFNANLNGSPISGQFSAARLRVYSIGTGLNATQAAAFSAAVIEFNTALGR
jgi:hypothetical protein